VAQATPLPSSEDAREAKPFPHIGVRRIKVKPVLTRARVSLRVLLSHSALRLLDAIYHLFRRYVLQQFLELRIARSW
jgi:hypothetical protein